MKYTVDDMLKELEEHKDQDKKMIDSILRSPAKAKRKELKRERNLILKTTYPILSLGLRWTNHIETIDEQSDVLMVTIDPLYLPWTKENAVSLAIGKKAIYQPRSGMVMQNCFVLVVVVLGMTFG